MGALTRRAALAAAALLLAGCGTTVKVAGNRTVYALDAAGTSPPVGDLARLLTARARATGMNPVLTAGGALGLPQTVRGQTALGQYDPAIDKRPPVNRVVVVAAVDPRPLAPELATARRHGVAVVTYPVALAHRSAAVRFDIAAAARALARAAAPHARGEVLLLLPPAAARGLNPYADSGPAIAAAVRGVLPRVRTATAMYAGGGAEAVREHPGVGTVLAWDDDTARGAAGALRGGWVGGLGAPAVTSRATLAALRRGDLQAVVAARPRDLARALVDLPRALLRGTAPRDVVLAPHTLTPGSAALAAYAADYAKRPGTTNYMNTPLNP